MSDLNNRYTEASYLKDDHRLVRLDEVLSLIPVSKSTWWAGVATGRYPQPVRIGPKIPAWRMRDISRLISEGIE